MGLPVLHEPPGRSSSGTAATSALTVCRSGHRAAVPASILAGAGYVATAVDGGGVEDVLRGS